jgi:hypothetical protein
VGAVNGAAVGYGAGHQLRSDRGQVMICIAAMLDWFLTKTARAASLSGRDNLPPRHVQGARNNPHGGNA